MKKYLLLLTLLTTVFLQTQAQEEDEPDPPKQGFDKSKLFFGGNFGLSFGNSTFINVSPQVGYRFNQYVAAGAGVNFNYSSIKYGSNPTQAITLPGLSDWVGSAELYFEKWGFQARASYRYRSTFLGEVAGLSAAPTYRQAKAEGILDAQIGYEFQSGALKGFSILAQAKNLTDRPFVTYQNNDPRQVIDYQRYGRDYYLGITYKF